MVFWDNLIRRTLAEGVRELDNAPSCAARRALFKARRILLGGKNDGMDRSPPVGDRRTGGDVMSSSAPLVGCGLISINVVFPTAADLYIVYYDNAR